MRSTRRGYTPGITRRRKSTPSRRERVALSYSGRLGVAARGATYLVVGLLTLDVGVHHQREPASREGALHAVARQPFGRVGVLALAIGFAGFVVWQALAAVVADDLLKRVSAAARALLYASFFFAALPFALHGARQPSKGGKEADVTAHVLGWPGGRAIVIAIGLAIVGAGVWQGYRGAAQRYRKKLRWRTMSSATRRVVQVVGTAGLLGRMTAWVLVGVFVMRAGWRHRPSDAGGLDTALRDLVRRPLGPLLVVLVAVGLMLFALYEFVEARYRDFDAAT